MVKQYNSDMLEMIKVKLYSYDLAYSLAKYSPTHLLIVSCLRPNVVLQLISISQVKKILSLFHPEDNEKTEYKTNMIMSDRR